MKSRILKALCITALLTPTLFFAMERWERPEEINAKRMLQATSLGAWTNETNKDLDLEKIHMGHEALLPYLGTDTYSRGFTITKVLPEKTQVLSTPIFNYSDTTENKIYGIYKLTDRFNKGLIAEFAGDPGNNSITASLYIRKKELETPISKDTIDLDKLPMDKKIYVLLKAAGNELEKSEVKLTTQAPIATVEAKPKEKKLLWQIYIPGFFRKDIYINK